MRSGAQPGLAAARSAAGGAWSVMSPSARSSNLFTVALVGAAALKGKEVRDVLSERSFPAVEIKLLDEEDVLGQLEQVNDEPAFIQGVLPEHLEGVDFAFLTADESYIAKTWATVRDSGAEIIDLSYALENNTDIVLRAPWVERELGRTRRGCAAVGAGRDRSPGRCGDGACFWRVCRRPLRFSLPPPSSASLPLNTDAAAWMSFTIRP